MKDTNIEVGSENSKVLTVGVSLLIAGLVVGFVIGWYSHSNGYVAPVDNSNVLGEATTTQTISAASTTAPLPQNLYKTVTVDASVSALDQKAGNLVFIQHVGVKVPTWVAVRDITNGAVGNILGAEMVTSATDDLPVTLLRPTKSGQKYAVFLYQENGDGEFNFKTDELIMQGESPVSTLFTAQ